MSDISTAAEMQETSLCYCRGDKEMKISTSDTTFKTLMRNRGWTPYETSGEYENYMLPIEALTIRTCNKKTGKATRNISPAVREARAARMRQLHAEGKIGRKKAASSV